MPWTTEPAANGLDARDEDVARLSPLGFDHVWPLRRHPARPNRPRRTQATARPQERRRRELKCSFGSAATGPPGRGVICEMRFERDYSKLQSSKQLWLGVP